MHTQLTQETDPALTLSSCLDTYNRHVHVLLYNYVRVKVWMLNLVITPPTLD